jgi:hypothetical protein
VVGAGAIHAKLKAFHAPPQVAGANDDTDLNFLRM